MSWVPILFIIIFLLFSYFTNVRKFYIKSNKSLVIKYYFKKLLFLFGITTFIYSINSDKINFRYRERLFKDDIMYPIISFDNLKKEIEFNKSGKLDNINNQINNNNVSNSKINNFETLVLCDFTGSVSKEIDRRFEDELTIFNLNHNNQASDKINKIKGPSLLNIGIVNQLANNYEPMKFQLLGYWGHKELSYVNGSKVLHNDNYLEIRKVNSSNINKNLLELTHLQNTSFGSNGVTSFVQIINSINHRIQYFSDDSANVNIIILSDFIFEDSLNNSANIKNCVDSLSKNLINRTVKISLIELPLEVKYKESKDYNKNYQRSKDVLKYLRNKIPDVILYSWQEIALFNWNKASTISFLEAIISPKCNFEIDCYYDKNTKENFKLNNFIQNNPSNYCCFREVGFNENVLEGLPNYTLRETSELHGYIKNNWGNQYEIETIRSKKSINSKYTLLPLDTIHITHINILLILNILFILTIFFIFLIYVLRAWKNKFTYNPEDVINTKLGYIVISLIGLVGLIGVIHINLGINILDFLLYDFAFTFYCLISILFPLFFYQHTSK